MEMRLEPGCHTQVSLLKYDLLWESFPLLSLFVVLLSFHLTEKDEK